MPTTPEFQRAYSQLNPRQKEAVDAVEGPVMVVAGPGTGKTELLAVRVANILQKTQVGPTGILCLTYTDAAQRNMRERLAGIIGSTAYRVAIHTFHSFGREIINRYPEYFHGGAFFQPADDATQTEVLEAIFQQLPHGDPLRSEHRDQFVYLSRTKKAIEYLKKAGLTPAEFAAVLEENKKALAIADTIIGDVFDARVSAKMFPDVARAAQTIAAHVSAPLPGSFTPYTELLSTSLTRALDDTQEAGTAPLTAWKARWTKKGDDKRTHLKDLLDRERMVSLSDIYRQYSEQMDTEGFYDFNDMILDAIAMLESNTGIRLDLQEQFQYLLVDEFQDTNGAQMRLLHLLSDNPAHEGRPNIMTVGDDDQAIYKFQGAELSNILDFKELYRDPAVIVLTENYRSTAEILAAARHIIQKGTGRLENILPDLTKELSAANSKLKPGTTASKEFASEDLQYHWLAAEIGRLLGQGIPAREIAIIAREHRQLERLVPYFHAAKIPLAYERQLNVLQETHIRQLITMARFVDSLMRKQPDADDLLPEILNYPFWGLDRAGIWELSVTAARDKVPWLAQMRRAGGRFADIAQFFIRLGGDAAYLTAEEVLHELIGGPQLVLAGDADEDSTRRDGMFSPYRTFYFAPAGFAGSRAEYLRRLSSLQAFIGSLREYRRGRPLNLGDMLAFVDIHLKNNIPLNNVSPFVNAQNAVQLMTAHKAKGLQFDAVFVINCQEDVWAGSSGGRGGAPLPSNLPITPAGDDTDDQLRLFFVAITRAKRFLYLTSYTNEERLGFLAPGEHAPEFFTPETVALDDVGGDLGELLIRQLDAPHAGPFSPDEKALLSPVLEEYHMSVTHLQNFLNVADAGPAAFLEKNLLRFPEPQTPSSAFGTAVHRTLQNVFFTLKESGKLPKIADVLAWFAGHLEAGRLNPDDYARMLKRGQTALPVFYEGKKKTFSAGDIVERNFRDQGVLVGGVRLSGQIDRILVSGKEMVVCDFKTGKAVRSWEPSDPYERIKAWKYRMQLAFYKLLIENSRDFGGSSTVSRGLIEFVEPSRGALVELPLEIDPAEVERLSRLIVVVSRKIASLEFPDISGYRQDISGIKAFEDDLLA